MKRLSVSVKQRPSSRKGIRSKESAMKVLVESEIYTESGKLSKNYRA